MNPLRGHWTLDPEVVFLNHGSFGACPRVVLEAQQRFRERLEAEPVRFFVREVPALLDAARERLAAFLGAAPEALAFVSNATEGVNSAVRSCAFGAGDEVLVTDHEYNASRNALEHVAAERGAAVVLARLPFPIRAPEDAVAAIAERLTTRTRLVLLDHVTSPTGLVLPIASIAALARERGADVLVDGAHAPGMIDLDLEALGRAGVTWYTGNCHKWLCAPKGAAFLWARGDRVRTTRPAIISHGANAPPSGRSRYRQEFDWPGTRDPTPWLCVPHALDFLEGLVPGGIAAVRESGRALALAARDLLARRLGRAAPCPDSMIGSLAAIELPDREDETTALSAFDTDPLQDALLAEDGIEVPIVPFPAPPRRLVRVSAAAYNEIGEYEALADALVARL